MRTKCLRNRLLVLGLTSALLALSGCATQRAEVRVDKADSDLGKCSTFDWRPVSSDAASFTDQRVRAAALKHFVQQRPFMTAACSRWSRFWPHTSEVFQRRADSPGCHGMRCSRLRPFRP